MKLCTFEVIGNFGNIRRIGMVTPKGCILDLNAAYALTLSKRDNHPRAQVIADAVLPPDMVEFLRNEIHGPRTIAEIVDFLGDSIDDERLRGINREKIVWDEGEVSLLAPLPRPLSIRDTLSFLDHLRNAMPEGMDIPPVYRDIPAIYYKGNCASVQGPGTDIVWPHYTEQLDYELEFAAVIGKKGTNIFAEDAWDHIAGYMIFNDVSARDIQSREMGGMLGPAKGKDMDTGNVFGPYLVTPDEFDPRKENAMIARINGEEWSRGTTNMMDHDFGAIISYISQCETLYPGDVIGSGTVPTGCGIELKKYIKPGDVVELEVEGLGVLRNRVVRAGA